MSEATILVIEDEEDIRTLCRFNLEFEGYSVIEAGDGRQALDILDRQKPDLILLDLMMPEVDGWEVLERVKGDGRLSSIPVVLVTARSDLKNQLRGWKKEIDDYLTKPFSPTSLSMFVKRALQKGDPQDAAERRETIIEGLELLEEFGGSTEESETD